MVFLNNKTVVDFFNIYCIILSRRHHALFPLSSGSYPVVQGPVHHLHHQHALSLRAAWRGGGHRDAQVDRHSRTSRAGREGLPGEKQVGTSHIGRVGFGRPVLGILNNVFF